MPLTPEDVQNKRFTTVRFKEGYDEEEVDAFLDEVEAELRRLISDSAGLRASGPATVTPPPAAALPPPFEASKQPEPLAAPAQPAEPPNETALRTLLLAQRTADDAIAQAKTEADGILNAARARAASLDSESQQKHAGALAELARQRAVLEQAIDELRVFERDYRTRLKAYLDGQVRELERRGSVAPSPSASMTQPSASMTQPSASMTQPSASMAQPVASMAQPPTAAQPAPPAEMPRPVTPPASPPQPSAPPPVAAPAASPFTSVPGVAQPGRTPTPNHPSGPSSFSADLDAASDAPAGPPREAGEADSDAQS